LAVAAPAAAQSCWMGSVDNINFGTVSPDGRTDTQSNIAYTCQSNGSPTYFRACLFIAEGDPLSGINPRRMTNYNGAVMNYELYADPARTQVIGPPPAGGGFPVTTAAQVVSANYIQATSTFPVYGRVPAGQNLPATNTFQSGLGGSALYWSWSNTATPGNCMSGSGGTGSTNFYVGVTATVSNACRITLATDLDFGSVGSVSSSQDQTSQITVRCPSGTSWKLGLNNGANASGATRRMRSPAGNYVNYELYRDGGRSQRWGNTAGTDTSDGTGAGETSPITRVVYGRVPAQTTVPQGTYSDTVTITLTY
jgi:spore coat protein U-like protein